MITGEALNSKMKNGRNGKIILNPRMSTKTEIQSGVSF
jgi:hypothetical protein